VSIDRAALLRSAEKLLRQGKLDQAIAEYLRVVDAQPGDWNTANVLGDLYMRAGQTDKAVEQFTRSADSLSTEGFLSRAGALYKKILKIRPDDEHALLQAAEVATSQGLLADARAYLNALGERRRSRGDAAGFAAILVRLGSLDPDDYHARLAGAMARVQMGDVAAAVDALKALAAELTERDRSGHALVVLREATRVAPDDLPIKSALVRLLALRTDAASVDEMLALAGDLADAAAARGDWSAAAETLQDALTRAANHIPTLLRLVEIGVDGGLETVIGVAQVQLADAYLAAGSGTEARCIAEDLVARHPEDPEHVERLRRALTILGEPDPDAIIANRLTGFEGFGTLEEQSGRSERVEMVADIEVAKPIDAVEPVEPVEPIELVEPIEQPVEPIEPFEPIEPVELFKPIESNRRSKSPLAEIDLTVVLDDMKGSQVLPQLESKDLDSVFAQFRDEASQRLSKDTMAQDFSRGMELYQAGRLDEAVAPLEAASRAPRYRFEAATTLGRIFLEGGETWRAIEWLERAAQAPAPTPEEGHQLLYELADALEAVGEISRALAICLELRAEAGDYQDVAARVNRLAKVQARG
jgi:tetratricopeptide (TPR) repeat protein